MKKYIIAIPTYKRSDRLIHPDRMGPLNIIPNDVMVHTCLFVREEEMESYLPVAEQFGCGLLPLCLEEEQGIGETRDLILDYCVEENIEIVIMMDDDLKFAIHYYQEQKTRYSPLTPEEFREMINDLIKYTDSNNPLTGISARQFSNTKHEYLYHNAQIIQLHCIHVPTVMDNDIHFYFGVPYFEDSYFLLRLLTSGFSNVVLNKYVRDDIPNEKGGCSVKRTAELHSKSAVALYRLFPNVMQLVQKSNGSWKDPRINGRFQWKKAYRIGQEKLRVDK